MQQIISRQIKRRIADILDVRLEAASEGFYVIGITASARGEKGISNNRTDDDDLRVEIDGRPFPQLSNPHRLFDSPGSFSGGQLHGKSKTVFFCIFLPGGAHVLRLIPDHSPYIEEIIVWYVDATVKELEFSPDIKSPESDRQPWQTYVLCDMPLLELDLSITCAKRWRDSDDVKLTINGRTIRNFENKKSSLWFWLGRLLRGKRQQQTFTINRGRETQYIELWSDRQPTLNNIRFNFGKTIRRIPTVWDPVWTGSFKDDTEQMILTRALFGEARGTWLSDQVRIGVAWTIRHRVEDERSRWGKTYHDVITQTSQYSAFNTDEPNRPYVENPLWKNTSADKKMWPRCYEIAGNIIAGSIPDPTNGANHYHDTNQGITPWWATNENLTVEISPIRFFKL